MIRSVTPGPSDEPGETSVKGCLVEVVARAGRISGPARSTRASSAQRARWKRPSPGPAPFIPWPAPLVVAAVLGTPGGALANIEDELESGQIIAVEDRPYRMIHEFSVHGGVLPTDAMYVGVSLGGSYTLHLSDLWAWEAISFHYSANIDTNLESELSNRFGVLPDPEPRLQYLLTSSAIFTPFFGKQAVFNSDVALQGVYLALGGGIANLGGDDQDFFLPQISAGPGIRIFFGQVVSTRLDIRAVSTFNDANGLEVDVLLHTFLSFSFNFGKKRATELGDDETADSRTGFEKLDELFPQSNPDVVIVDDNEEPGDE